MKGLLYVLGVPLLIIAVPVILYVIIDRLINQPTRLTTIKIIKRPKVVTHWPQRVLNHLVAFFCTCLIRMKKKRYFYCHSTHLV